MIKKIKSQLDKLKQKLSDSFNADGSSKISFDELLDLKDKIKQKELKLYTELEWNKITGGDMDEKV